MPQPLLLTAQAALADAMFAAFDAGLDPSLVAAAASAAAYAAARVRNRVAAAALHNDDSGPGGPEVMLPLADDVLVTLSTSSTSTGGCHDLKRKRDPLTALFVS